MEIDDHSPRVRFPPPLVFLGAVLAGVALEKWVGSPEIPVIGYGVLHTLGMLALVLGIGIILSAHGLFLRSKADTRPWKASDALVIEGVYKWTRNPMYLGMALTHAGIAFLLDSLTVLGLLLPVIVVITREVIEPEEAYLERRFGEPYRTYRASVRRWI